MASEKERLATLLRALAELVQNSTAAELDALSNGRVRLGIAGKGGEGVAGSDAKRSRPAESHDDTSDISDRLLALESREEGIRFLEAAQLTRRNLEALARSFEVPVRKEDNLERLRDRIIDATIGARLNSQAIRGGR